MTIRKTYHERKEQRKMGKKLERNAVGLTTRQARTHDLIVKNSELGRKTPIDEIIDNYPYDAETRRDGYIKNTSPRTHHPCIQVYDDIDALNMNLGIHKAHLWDKEYNYWISHDIEEVKAFCKPLYERQGKKKLWKQGILMLKARRHGQMRLIFESESEAREYWETFIDSIKGELVDELIKEGNEDEQHKEE